MSHGTRVHGGVLPSLPPFARPIMSMQMPAAISRILQDCEEHDDGRSILFDFDTHLSIPEMLGTPNGIEALAKFIRCSGAFKEPSLFLFFSFLFLF